MDPQTQMQSALVSLNERKCDHLEVVRLATSCWHDERGLHMRRRLLSLKRKSVGVVRMLQEDSDMIGADEVLRSVVNLNECKDGEYIVVTCNVSTDWESGHVDSYDYKLLPYVEASEPEGSRNLSENGPRSDSVSR